MQQTIGEKTNATIGEVATRIAASGTIAIILPDAPDWEVVALARALSEGIKKLEKVVSIFASPLFPPRALAAGWAPQDETEPLREFIISFDLTRSPIKELKYERDAQRLNIILSPTASRIRREDVLFRYGPLRYDLVITLGVPTLEAAAQSIARVPELPYEKPIVNLDANPANTGYGEINLIHGKENGTGEGARTSLAEVVYEILAALKVPEDPEIATSLFAALSAATHGFRPNTTQAKDWLMAGELIRRGADPTAVSRSLAPGEEIWQAKLAARAVVRSRFEEKTRTLWALITKEDVMKTAPEEWPMRATIEAVLGKIVGVLPQAEYAVLLWQHPHEETFQAILGANRPEGMRALGRIAGTSARPNAFLLPQSFPSPRAAEEYIRQLLPGTDTVE